MSSKVVVRHLDGQVIKGYTDDFSPGKEWFHLVQPGAPENPIMVPLKEIKAVFFVKDFAGDPSRKDVEGFSEHRQMGKEVFLEFMDGERMWGFSMNYSADSQGFFVFPADKGGNNEKIYVNNAAVTYVLYD